MKFTYLALGDSYTIGEAVLLKDSFPYQTVQMLRQQNIAFAAAEIVAKTGFTTDELLNAINETKFLYQYDFVSVLIGVNNQYRGRAVENYSNEFENILLKAIQFAGGNCKKVYILSIPNWGVTPFAADKNTVDITKEIAAFNDACKNITLQNNCIYIDITTAQVADSQNSEMLASDGLHPSGLEYKKWATQISNTILQEHFS